MILFEYSCMHIAYLSALLHWTYLRLDDDGWEKVYTLFEYLNILLPSVEVVLIILCLLPPPPRSVLHSFFEMSPQTHEREGLSRCIIVVRFTLVLENVSILKFILNLHFTEFTKISGIICKLATNTGHHAY